MLILTRKLGESITIGDNIRVSVLGVRGRQVRLGIDAPADVIVHREEIYVKIQEENRRAVGNTRNDLMGMVRMIKSKITGETGLKKPSVVDYKDKPPQRRDAGSEK